jgi:copper resistance protein D
VTALVLCRFAQTLALMLAFGGSVFVQACAPEPMRAELAQVLRPLVRTAAIVAVVAALVWLALETASIMDNGAAAWDAHALFSVLTGTAFGRAWGVHLVLAVALLAAAFWRRVGRVELTLLSALALASLALVGHAAMQSGAIGLAHRANDALHLLSAGAWAGGLPPFVLCLDASRRAVLRWDAVTAMTRFSFYGHFAVATVVATGIANVAMTSGLPLPPSTPYRALLDAKIAIVAAMVGLALVNRYGLAPRISTWRAAFATMRALTLVNIGLATLVVALVSVFGTLDPA